MDSLYRVHAVQAAKAVIEICGRHNISQHILCHVATLLLDCKQMPSSCHALNAEPLVTQAVPAGNAPVLCLKCGWRSEAGADLQALMHLAG